MYIAHGRADRVKFVPRNPEPEFLGFQGPQASIPQNRFLVRNNSVVELILGRGGGGPE
jgi:hypothetical protein